MVSCGRNGGDKKLMQIKMNFKHGDRMKTVIRDYSYDLKGKLSFVTETELNEDGTKDIVVVDYDWKDSVIAGEIKYYKCDEKLEHADSSEPFTIFLENGKICEVKEEYRVIKYTYNSFNQIIKLEERTRYYLFASCNEYDKGSLVRSVSKFKDFLGNGEADGEWQYAFHYEGKSFRGYCPYVFVARGDVRSIVSAHPELLGYLDSEHLVNNSIVVNSDAQPHQLDYTYIFDSEGYMTEMTETSEIDTTCYTYLWK